MTPVITNTQLAERVIRTRKRQRLSQQALAKASGIDQSQVSRIEGGKVAQPSVVDVASLAAGLGLPHDALIGMEDREFEKLLDKTPQVEKQSEAQSRGQLSNQLIDALDGGLRAAQLIEDIDLMLQRFGSLVIRGGDAEGRRYLAESFLCLSSLQNLEIAQGLNLTPPIDRAEGSNRWAVRALATAVKNTRELFEHSGASIDAVKESLGFGDVLLGGAMVIYDDADETPQDQVFSECVDGTALLRRYGCLKRHTSIILISLDPDNRVARVDQLLDSRGGALSVLPLQAVDPNTGRLEQTNAPVGEDFKSTTPEHWGDRGSSWDEAKEEIVSASNLLLTGVSATRERAVARYALSASEQGGAIVLYSPNPQVTQQAASLISQDSGREEDLVIASVADPKNPLAYNPLEVKSLEEIRYTTAAVSAWLKKLMGVRPGEPAPPALNYAEQAVQALCEANLRGLQNHPGMSLTLMQLPLFLTDALFRHTVMEFCTNLSIRFEFDADGPFERMGEKAQAKALSPLLRALNRLTANDWFGNVFGQSSNALDLPRLVEEQKIIILEGDSALGDAEASRALGIIALNQAVGAARGSEEPCTIIIDQASQVLGEELLNALTQGERAGLRFLISESSPELFEGRDFALIRSATQSYMSARIDPMAGRIMAELIGGSGAYSTDLTAEHLSNLAPGELWGNFELNGYYTWNEEGKEWVAHPEPETDRASYGPQMYKLDKDNPANYLEVKSDLGTPADVAWEMRSHHVRNAMAVMQKRISDRAAEYGKPKVLAPEEAAFESGDWKW